MKHPTVANESFKWDDVKSAIQAKHIKDIDSLLYAHLQHYGTLKGEEYARALRATNPEAGRVVAAKLGVDTSEMGRSSSMKVDSSNDDSNTNSIAKRRPRVVGGNVEVAEGTEGASKNSGADESPTRSESPSDVPTGMTPLTSIKQLRNIYNQGMYKNLMEVVFPIPI